MEFKQGDRIRAVSSVGDTSEFTLLRHENYGVNGVVLVSGSGQKFASIDWRFEKIEPPIPTINGVVFIDQQGELVLCKNVDNQVTYYDLTARQGDRPVTGWKPEMGMFNIIPAPEEGSEEVPEDLEEVLEEGSEGPQEEPEEDLEETLPAD